MMIGYYDIVPVKDLHEIPRPPSQPAAKLPPLDPALKKLAEHALDSEEAFDAFAAAVHQVLPQVDRVCVSSYYNGTFAIEQASYPGKVERKVMTGGFEGTSRFYSLVHWALLGGFVYNPELNSKDPRKRWGMDVDLLKQTLNSSAHVPVALEGGKPATINFWSKTKDAFPADKQDLLRALAAAVADAKR
jgi:hypothetical protein